MLTMVEHHCVSLLAIRQSNIQGLLDGVLPKLIPLLITLGIYVLIKKGWTPVKCIILILVVGILGCAFGIWTGDSKAWTSTETQFGRIYTAC